MCHFSRCMNNKANLRDLIAAYGLVILLKLDLKSWIFQPVWPCNLMDDPKKNKRAPLLCYFKLFASFHSHWWIQTGVTVRKRLIWVNIDAFFEPCVLEIWRMTFKINRAPLLCYFKLLQHFVAIGEFKLELESGNAQSGSNLTLFRAVWPWILTDDLEKQ